MTIEEIKSRKEDQTFDCKCIQIDPKALAVPIDLNEKVPSGSFSTWNLMVYFLFALKNSSKKSICF